MDDKVHKPSDPFEKTVVDLKRASEQVTEPAPEPGPGDDNQSIDFDLKIPPPPAQVDLALVDIDKDTLPIVIDRRQGKVLEEQHRHELDLEDRRFRNWMMKTLVTCFCVVVVLVVGGMIYSTYVKGNNTSESTLKAFLEAVTEILKVLKPESTTE
jgi:hypothetical protein